MSFGAGSTGNDKARRWAEENGLAMISGSDFHSRDQLAKGGIDTDDEIQDEDDFLRVLQERRYSLIEPV